MRLYQPYEQKILQIAEIKEKIMRYKYIILACFLAILAGIAALLYFKGDIQKDIQLQQTYTYGDTISCEATAFFAKPTIEFYQNDQRIDKTPEYPGQYKARVVTKGSFGIKKYGEWHNFIIQQKPASYTVETSFTYGEYPSVRMDGLCENDRLVYDETQVRFIDLELSQPKAEILSGAIKILNQENESVEHCYLFNNGAVGVYEVQLQARKIVLNTGSISKEYDGKVTS